MSKQIAIHFHGVKPDQMDREGSSAIIEGSMGPGGIVEANNLLLKCPPLKNTKKSRLKQ